MRCWGLILTAAVCAALAGCATPPGNDPGGSAVSVEQQNVADSWAVESIRDAAINNAIISQHTLYPYHFVANSAELNELGRRDLGALIAHYRTNPGAINVRRGDTPEQLYSARVNAVNKALSDAGLDTGRIKVADGLPGGTGISGDRMVRILDAEAKRAETAGQGTQMNMNVTDNTSGSQGSK